VVSKSTVGQQMALGQLLANCRQGKARCPITKTGARVSLEQVAAADIAAERVHRAVTRDLGHLEHVGPGLGGAGQETRPQRMIGKPGGIEADGFSARTKPPALSGVRPIRPALLTGRNRGPSVIAAATSHACSVSTGRR
jgi:hypothetical protein